MILIYNYLDYRKFLKELLKYKKEENPKFSHRYIISKLDISSSGYLINVIANKSSLNIQRAIQIGRILGLSAMENNYFKKLILFDKAKTIEEKNEYYKQIIDYRKRKVRFINGDQFTLFSKWYFVVIREMLHAIDFKDNYSNLAKAITPSISKIEAEKAISILKELKLIEINENGFYKPIDKAIATGDDISARDVTNYQSKMINLSQFALEAVPIKEREISGLTLSISNEKFQLIKSEIQEFRKRMLQIASEDSNPERIFRCNFQLFPLSDDLGELK
jgi:uncharacterized protein (TIGR02147 family)